MNGSDLSPRRKIFGRLSVVAGNSVQIAGLVTAYLSLSAAQSAHSTTAAVVAMVVGWVLLYFCCHAIAHWAVGRILGIRLLYRRRDWQSRRLARWTPVVVRTSSFFWSADGEGLEAKGHPNCQSDHVVCGSDFFRGCPKPG